MHYPRSKAINDKMLFLVNLINNYNIDGIECFHPSIDADRRKLYIKFANDNDLLISAGSDFHGSHLPHRKNITTEASLEDIKWLEGLK